MSMSSPQRAAIDLPDRLERERFAISDLCSEFDVTPRALRFYEDEGLLAPRREGLARIYSRRDRARLVWILRAKRVGFSLAEAREMIDLYDLDDGRVTQRHVARDKCQQRIAQLRRQREDIDSAVAELEAFVRVLDQHGDAPAG